MPPSLESSFKITPIALRHAESMQQLANDFEVAKWTRLPYPYPLNGAVQFISHQIMERDSGNAFIFAMKYNNTFVGACGLHNVTDDSGPELGYWVGKQYWGNGYATRATQLLIRFGFEQLHLSRIHAHAIESNSASRRVLEKSGFRFLGLKEHFDKHIQQPHTKIALYEITQKN
jgi:RimJ/RimL family protein N-acetyltransferase